MFLQTKMSKCRKSQPSALIHSWWKQMHATLFRFVSVTVETVNHYPSQMRCFVSAAPKISVKCARICGCDVPKRGCIFWRRWGEMQCACAGRPEWKRGAGSSRRGRSTSATEGVFPLLRNLAIFSRGGGEPGGPRRSRLRTDGLAPPSVPSCSAPRRAPAT